MPALKNPRHELFAREYAKTGGVGAEAYRRVYPRAKPNTTAKVNASYLLTFPNIRARCKELTKIMIKRSDVTMDNILTEYEEARQIAREQLKSGEMQTASERKAKLVGLLRERVETGAPGDFDNAQSLEEIVNSVSELVSPQAAQALAKAFGLELDPQALLEAESPSDAVN